MENQQKDFSPAEKLQLLKLHLLEEKPISEICQEQNISVELFDLWQKQFFESGHFVFERKRKTNLEKLKKRLASWKK
jgi:transposase